MRHLVVSLAPVAPSTAHETPSRPVPSLADIYRAHAPQVYNLALGYTQRVEDAEEVTQDVFLKFHEARERFRGDAAVATWLYRATVNAAIDRERYRKRERRGGGRAVAPLHDLTPADTPRSLDHPGVALEDKEAMATLFAHINALPEQQRTALLLLKVEGLSQRETAEVMELSAKAVESLFSRAKKNLAARLDAAKDR